MNIYSPVPDTKEEMQKQINYLAEALEERLMLSQTFQDVSKEDLKTAEVALKTGFMWFRRALEKPTQF